MHDIRNNKFLLSKRKEKKKNSIEPGNKMWLTGTDRNEQINIQREIWTNQDRSMNRPRLIDW